MAPWLQGLAQVRLPAFTLLFPDGVQRLLYKKSQILFQNIFCLIFSSPCIWIIYTKIIVNIFANVVNIAHNKDDAPMLEAVLFNN
jgi:hypothetical protein